MDWVEGALDVREEEYNFLVVVEVVKPLACKECGEVLAVVFGAESVLVCSVGVGLFRSKV